MKDKFHDMWHFNLYISWIQLFYEYAYQFELLLENIKELVICMFSLTNHSPSPISLKESNSFLLYKFTFSYCIKFHLNNLPNHRKFNPNSSKSIWLRIVIYQRNWQCPSQFHRSTENQSYSSNETATLLLYRSLSSFECQYFLFSNLE